MPDAVFVIDAANLRTGGGVQVASSVISQVLSRADDAEARARWPLLAGLHVVASAQVLANLPPAVARDARVVEGSRTWRGLLRAGEPCDVAFTVFGPEYSRSRATRRLVGCGDGIVLLDRPQGLPRPRITTGLRRRLKRALWRWQGRHFDLVVEAGHLRERLVELGVPDHRVHVVPNCVHEVFSQPGRWREPPAVARAGADILLLYVARAHPHKNHSFLLELHRRVRERHGLRVRTVVTLTGEEWSALGGDAACDALENVGAVDVAQLPRLYEACDAVVFPSLLETFSATPLEAIAMGRPLLASDRDFVREVVGDEALYFDPLDPVASADEIARWWRSTAWPSTPHDGRAPGLDAEQRAARLLDLCHVARQVGVHPAYDVRGRRRRDERDQGETGSDSRSGP